MADLKHVLKNFEGEFSPGLQMGSPGHHECLKPFQPVKIINKAEMRAKGEVKSEIKFDRMEVQLVRTPGIGDFDFGAVYRCRSKTGTVYFGNHGSIEFMPYIFYVDKRTSLQIVDPGEIGDITIMNAEEIEKIWFISWEHHNIVNSVIPSPFSNASIGLDILIHFGDKVDLLNIKYTTLAEGNIAIIAELDMKDPGKIMLKNKSHALYMSTFEGYKKLLDVGEMGHINGFAE